MVQRAKTNWSLALVLLADSGVDPATGRVLDLLLIEHHQNYRRQQTSVEAEIQAMVDRQE